MSNFQEQVAASEVLTERYGPISDYVVNAIYEKFGIHVPKSAVAKMNCVKVSTYAGSDDYVTDWADEAVLIDEVRIARERERLSAALEANDDSPAARDIAARLASMSGPERLAWARANNVAEPAKKQAQARGEGQSIEAKATLVEKAALLSGGAKIAFARKHGLL
ncbi:hypothetical protein [Jannaschia sp. M317]|uniref:hypothetical protein n=1 Tax=Jannaschia sp. M317 TaxID=2867011 RepID=UPI0021A810D5|nr:hypothetical protein [Jannaschia sp. M317]UWQ17079.1 hypothetical protein K3551_14460 [Jannaschia sp. M317]